MITAKTRVITRAVPPRRLAIFAWALTTCLSTGLVGCLNGTQAIRSNSVVRGCQMGADQFGTLSGRWPSLPVPIAFQANDWTSSTVQPLLRAADTWNAHTQAVFGVGFLDYGSSAQPRSSTDPAPQSLCSEFFLPNGRFERAVVIYRRTTWPYSSSSGKADIARTTVCTQSTPGQRIDALHSAILEVNTEDYFVPGKPQPDLQTIISHELGHLLGLRHSCEDQPQAAGVPSCSALGPGSLYRVALMFPTFFYDASGAGEVKRSLGANDQGRLNCLYSQSPQGS